MDTDGNKRPKLDNKEDEEEDEDVYKDEEEVVNRSRKGPSKVSNGVRGEEGDDRGVDSRRG